MIGFVLQVVIEIWMDVFFYNPKVYKKDALHVDKEPSLLLELSGVKIIMAIFTTITSSSSEGLYLIFLILHTLYIFYIYYRLNFTLATFTFANTSIRAIH